MGFDSIQEDEFGRIRAVDVKAAQRAQRKRLLSEEAGLRIRRGMIRYLVVVLDFSRAASMDDIRPSRGRHLLDLTRQFIREFFDQNPLSHLSLVIMRHGRAEMLSSLSGSPESHVAKLAGGQDFGGPASLQNALDMAVNSLKSVPPYGHREVLFLFAGLSSCDPGGIWDSIKQAKQQKCRVSVVGLAAEVFICREITKETGGTYSVALSDMDIEERIREHAPPPPHRATDGGDSLVHMGFPQQMAEGPAAAVFVGAECKMRSSAFTCPRCKGCVPELPCSCHICGLTLVSSSQLARSYHHLFPIQPFTEVAQQDLAAAMLHQDLLCHGCMQPLTGAQDAEAAAGVVLSCPECRQLYCFECDTYIHKSLHNCPGCEELQNLTPAFHVSNGPEVWNEGVHEVPTNMQSLLDDSD
eukprot:jgi/Astpho2/9977/e_gw1.00153.17.1_t